MKINKILIGMVAVFVSMGVMASEPVIHGVMVQQRWPWSRLVDIDYMLKCDSQRLMDVSISVYNGDDLLDVPAGSFSGDLDGVLRGPRRIVWDPTKTAYTNDGALTEFRVELTAAQAPLYMIVDLTKSKGDTGQIEYVHESDLTNNFWGAWVRDPVTNVGTVIQSVIWTGVTTNNVYKTDKLVLRRIPKVTTEPTTLTKDFYAGVFEVTQRQWELINGNKPSSFNNSTYYETRPLEKASYNTIRGATNSNPAIDWPATGTLVLSTSFMGKLRAKTGLVNFDLPTEAQWEYVCRAGTTTYHNDGIPGAPNTTSNAQLNVLGRYRYNGGQIWNGTKYISPAADCGPENGTAIVGTYLPNAWGLYDTHGNVTEYCLDWRTVGDKRVVRGGTWDGTASLSSSGNLSQIAPNGSYWNYGLRLVTPVP
ncbi:MAG: formylglycine-generating enzyme family protein [Kiritimatiellia bacterium]